MTILADHFTIFLPALPLSTLDHNHFHDIKTIKFFFFRIFSFCCIKNRITRILNVILIFLILCQFWGQLSALDLGFKDTSKKEAEKLFRIRRINCLLGRVICCNCKCNYRQGCSFYCLVRSSWVYIKGLLIIEQYPPFSFDSVWLVQVHQLSAGRSGKIKLSLVCSIGR